jgi:hypothetical protein
MNTVENLTNNTNYKFSGDVVAQYGDVVAQYGDVVAQLAKATG